MEMNLVSRHCSGHGLTEISFAHLQKISSDAKYSIEEDKAFRIPKLK
jgi:hypothetical protein